MLVAAIIISILILLALLRFGIVVEYSDAGFALWVKAGFIKLRLKEKDKKEKKKKAKKKEKKPVKRGPGNLSEFLDMLKAVKNALGRLRRKLLIKQLTLYYTSASDDPAKTAIQFGAANAVFGAIMPVMERYFKIKRRDLRTAADFDAKENGIYAKIIISIALWEALYTVLALLPLLTAKSNKKSNSSNGKTDKTERKDEPDNGKTTDK